MNFQRSALYIMFGILIVLLIIIAYNMHNALKNAKWPPIIGDCPDYWFDDGKNGSKCTVNSNNVNRGRFEGEVMNFAAAPYNTSRGLCAKYRWSTTNDVSWDGITYGRENNPCITKKTPDSN